MKTAERYALAEDELAMVVGGDYGDARKDNEDEPRYKIGEYVEQYWTPLHLSTHRRKVTGYEKRWNLFRSGKNWYWCYHLDGSEAVIDADSIQSK